MGKDFKGAILAQTCKCCVSVARVVLGGSSSAPSARRHTYPGREGRVDTLYSPARLLGFSTALKGDESAAKLKGVLCTFACGRKRIVKVTLKRTARGTWPRPKSTESGHSSCMSCTVSSSESGEAASASPANSPWPCAGLAPPKPKVVRVKPAGWPHQVHFSHRGGGGEYL